MSRSMTFGAGAALLLVTLGAGAAAASSPPTSPAPGGTDAGDYEAAIVRDERGVPHITAADWGSLGFGQGYALGEDRACTLLDQVVKVRGERAQLVRRRRERRERQLRLRLPPPRAVGGRTDALGRPARAGAAGRRRLRRRLQRRRSPPARRPTGGATASRGSARSPPRTSTPTSPTSSCSRRAAT